VYWRRADRAGLVPVAGGFPARTRGLVDTHDLCARGETVALADKSGYVYASEDRGETWRCVQEGLPYPSGVVLI